MTMDEPVEDELEAGPSSAQVQTDITPKLDHRYFDKEMCYAPPKKNRKITHRNLQNFVANPRHTNVTP